jgi:hypothetical protein
MSPSGRINAGNHASFMSCWQVGALLAAPSPQRATEVPCLSYTRHVGPSMCLTECTVLAGLLQAGGPRSVPPPSQTMWAKVNEFVFGL